MRGDFWESIEVIEKHLLDFLFKLWWQRSGKNSPFPTAGAKDSDFEFFGMQIETVSRSIAIYGVAQDWRAEIFEMYA